jgi:hypothetical protein
MMSLEILGTPEYYRKRAAEMRRLADSALNQHLRDSYLKIAADWDMLASYSQADMPPPSSNESEQLKL